MLLADKSAVITGAGAASACRLPGCSASTAPDWWCPMSIVIASTPR